MTAVMRIACSVLVLFLGWTTFTEAQAAVSGKEGVFSAIAKWLPLIGKGFGLNVAMSFVAMLVGTVLGLLLGVGQVSLSRPVRTRSGFVTQFFRNAPWLVLLFYCVYVLPYRISIFGNWVEIPNWIWATIGFTLPVMANVSEITRGAIHSIPKTQWEAAESLCYTRFHTLWEIILPQCVKRMLPPWMNIYAILIMATPLASIVGVEDAMWVTRAALGAEQRSELLIPMYSALLLAFFTYCYPVARLTRVLEMRYQVNH